MHYFDREHVGVPDAPISGPWSWSAAQMADHARWTHELDAAEVQELQAAVDAATRAGTALNDLTAESFPLPRLGATAKGWAAEVRDGRGFVLVRGLPVDNWSMAETELACWGLGQHLGAPGAQNGSDELLGHVTDYGDDANEPHGRQYRTREDIRFHCDAADAVGLLCVRPAAAGGLSRIVSSVAVFNELLETRPDLAARLCEEYELDARQDGDGSVAHLPVRPACFDGSRLRTFMHCGYFRSVTRHPGVTLSPIAAEALDAWEAIAERDDMRLDMDFRPGDLQLLSNHTIAHARTGYDDHRDPKQKRHLLRLWLSL